jgi:inorganic pyrophosphatase
MNLTTLSSFDGDSVRVVVEAPRGCSLKLEYNPENELFTVSRSLPLGMVYPFDWGFIPGTRADDGDPVDAMAIHSSSSFPGVVLPCRLLGMVEIEQKDDGGKKQTNNRLIAMPAWHEPLKELNDARDLPASVRHELEQFFVAVTAFTDKKVKVRGWAGRTKALHFLKKRITSSDSR